MITENITTKKFLVSLIISEQIKGMAATKGYIYSCNEQLETYLKSINI